ncbi:MAG: 6-phosphogluconolactonase [Deltaproteobacteria bacterium]|nr:6-phosphogluconolactonase [Deltaproteobacteria bacterium]
MHSPFRQGLNVYPDAASLAKAGVLLFIDSCERALKEKGFFSVLLSGGSSPLELYRLLSSKEYCARVKWDKTHLFWGDERCVGPSSSESNFKAASESLLSRADIPAENIHRIKGELTPEKAASSYENELASFFGLEPGEPPPFDLVLLGLGRDGHTLSLFPGTKALIEDERLVVANHAPDNAWRVTLTLRALERARRSVFIVSGAEKAVALRDVFDGKDLPAAKVRAKELFWLADSEAASCLKG